MPSDTEQQPAAQQEPAPTPPVYATRPADPSQAPDVRRANYTVDRLRDVCTRLEVLRHRLAHTLGADDLAALQSVQSELQAMCGEPPPAAA